MASRSAPPSRNEADDHRCVLFRLVGIKHLFVVIVKQLSHFRRNFFMVFHCQVPRSGGKQVEAACSPNLSDGLWCEQPRPEAGMPPVSLTSNSSEHCIATVFHSASRRSPAIHRRDPSRRLRRHDWTATPYWWLPVVGARPHPFDLDHQIWTDTILLYA